MITKITLNKVFTAALFLTSAILFNSCSNNLTRTYVAPEPSILDFGPAPEKPGYVLVWSDEFNYTGKPDPSKWNYELGFARNNEVQWYQPDNANCKNGVLLIEGRRESKPNPTYQPEGGDWRTSRPLIEYSASSIITQNKASWLYGIFEVRARLDTATGAWPAIWTLGIDRSWPQKGEIDMLEFYRIDGQQNILANACHKAHGGNNWSADWDSEHTPYTHFLEKDSLWGEKFHTWKMDWDNKEIKLYLDDELLNTIYVDEAVNPSGFKPFTQPQYLLLNLALGGMGGDPTNSKFPITYEVDYVRIYQKIAPKLTPQPDEEFKIEALYSKLSITEDKKGNIKQGNESSWKFVKANNNYLIKNSLTGNYLTNKNDIISTTNVKENAISWSIEQRQYSSYRLKDSASGKYLSVERAFSNYDANLVLTESLEDEKTSRFNITKK